MTKESKGKCEAASHKLLKEKAKTRVQKLRGMFTNIQIARKEGRTADVAIFEDQMDGMLGRWSAELNDPSIASSLHGGSHGRLESFSDDLARFSKQQCDEKNDAESPLKDLPQPNLEGPEPEDFIVSFKGPPEDIFQDLEFPDVVPDVMPDICPPASAFKRPKCALWECSRPVHVLCQDYCSRGHAHLARNEGLPGKTPVLRPWGIALKDGSLFAALNDKTQGKDVGIPDCDEAAALRSPWDDSELFDLSLLEGETSREWLFFGRPRKAFGSGNRKRRSLRNYRGRWHVSRTQEMKEYGGQKRSYYMDPQPSSDREWHLFEYEVNNLDACALYRLELKFGTAKKSSKGKQSNDPVGRLTAEASTEVGNNSKGTTSKNADAGKI